METNLHVKQISGSTRPRKKKVASRLDERKSRLVVTFRADVTSTTVPLVAKSFTDSVSKFPHTMWKNMYFDIRYARILDSKGLHWLFQEIQNYRSLGKIITLQVASPAIYRIVCFSGLEKLVVLKYRRRKQTR
jgi:anti-anti-sigma regulatory factor